MCLEDIGQQAGGRAGVLLAEALPKSGCCDHLVGLALEASSLSLPRSDRGWGSWLPVAQLVLL